MIIIFGKFSAIQSKSRLKDFGGEFISCQKSTYLLIKVPKILERGGKLEKNYLLCIGFYAYDFSERLW